MTTQEYYALHPEARRPTYHGEAAAQGHLVIGEDRGEGFALVQCGRTSIQIPYTILHALQLAIDTESIHCLALCAVQRALYAVTCEAGLGARGLAPAPSYDPYEPRQTSTPS